MSIAHSVLIFVFTISAVSNVLTASVDPEVSKAVEEAITSDEFVISMRNIHHLVNRRKKTETLFSLEFPGTHQKFSLQLNRESKQVVANFKLHGELESRNFPLHNFTEESSIKTLLLSVRQSQPNAHLSLYIDCVSYGTIKTVKTFRDIFNNMRNPQILFYHERKYETDVDADLNIDDALLQNGCPSEIQAAQPVLTRESMTSEIDSDRGDLPPIVNDCSNNYLVKIINDLLREIKILREELDSQKMEIQRLRAILEKCNFCTEGSHQRPTLPQALCSSIPSPCFPGVPCEDTLKGPQCGTCPQGYIGNGRSCEPMISSCASNPCFRGVPCHDIPNGYQCGSCPAGYVGNGKNCIPTCSLRPCASGVSCEDTPSGFRCGTCPERETGNGRLCKPSLKFCDLKPCYQGVSCENTKNGWYVCGPCPPNYIGDGEICVEMFNQAVCPKDACFHSVPCQIVNGVPQCGPCPPDYIGDGRYCDKNVPTCVNNSCFGGVECQNTSLGFQCGNCPPGFRGDGRTCLKLHNSCHGFYCFPGVTCHETVHGPKCDPCPVGYKGDGHSCIRFVTCRENPCYPGVKCFDRENGYLCSRCPPNYVGDGQNCTRINFCQSTSCFPDVKCTDTVEGPRCGPCPNGYKGNGKTCIRWYTCDDHPCFPNVQCTDTPQGPKCGVCPLGYIGDGISCDTILTCLNNPCYPGVKCHDTPLGPACDSCPFSYVGDGRTCKWQYSCENNPCYPEVQCEDTVSGPKCGPCPHGFLGDGVNCTKPIICAAEPCYPDSPCSQRVVSENNITNSRIEVHTNSSKCGNIQTCTSHRCDETHTRICRNTCPPDTRCFPFPDFPFYKCVPCPYDSIQNGTCLNVDETSSICQICVKICVHEKNSSHTAIIRSAGETISQLEANKYMFCPDGTQCDINSECHQRILEREVTYYCKCKEGWAGPGKECGRDTDLDGWSDNNLHCKENNCRQDNCLFIPNSGQEDQDNDGIGDKCDDDVDNDGIPNNLDNCIFIHNPEQMDSDVNGGDNIGDACDNCPLVLNKDQIDTDKDGIGDACDNDIDNDGIRNNRDNCVMYPNSDQNDIDGDGIGDACDNCPLVRNADQADKDSNGVGDACDIGVDSDHDGRQDSLDNCPNYANSNQLDTDGDGIGDACDDDIDGDGIDNIFDNCPLRMNVNQTDTNSDGIGDVCQEDYDGDHVTNFLDNCPNNSKIFNTDFRTYQTVVLDPEGDSQIDPNWVVLNQGAEIEQTMNSDPGLAVGFDAFSGVDFEGTFYVDTDTDDDYIGFVFSYQSSRKFYAVMWKKYSQVYWQASPFRAYAEPGIHIKVVHSYTGPGQMMRNALWNTENVEGQTKILWKDPKNKGWKEKVAYRWLLLHRPHIGLIRLRIMEGENVITDSGNLFDSSFKGGRLGVMCFSQEMIIWSRLIYRCNDKIPRSIYNELSESFQALTEVDDTILLSKN